MTTLLQHLELGHLVALAGCVYILYFAITAVYLLYFHPLSKFPGSKRWILFRFFNARSLRTGDFIHDLRSMHLEYGPVIRFSHSELSYADPRAWKDIYGHHGGESNFPRHPQWYPKAPNGSHTVLSADNDSHARIRRLLAHAFSERALKEQESLVQVYFNQLIDKLHKQADGRDINIDEWFIFTTFDVAGDLEFGESFSCIENGALHPWIKVMLAHSKRLIRIGSALMVLPFLRPIVPYLIPKKLKEEWLQRFQFSQMKVAKRLELGDDPRRADFMSYVCRYNDEKGMTKEEIEATFDILVVAGSETTATALTAALHYLLRTPDKFDILRREIRSTFKTVDEITVNSTARLNYLTATINEALRLAPPAPTFLPRLVPNGGANICDTWVPGGTSVGISPFAISRMPDNFGDPDAFIPERWITGVETGLTHNALASNPFSFGPRNCLGRGLAWLEIRVILTKLIWHFDIEWKGKHFKWEDQKTFINWKREHLTIGLRPVIRA